MGIPYGAIISLHLLNRMERFIMTKMTIQTLADLMVESIKGVDLGLDKVLAEISGVKSEVTAIKGDVSDIKSDIAMMKAMMVKGNPSNAEMAGALACPHCGRALSKGEIDFCRKNNIEPSCYPCRNYKRNTAAKKPRKITQEEATTKYKYTAGCTNADGTHHTFEYTKPTYKKYVARCKELGVPLLLCPDCGKKFLEAKKAQEQEGVTDAF